MLDAESEDFGDGFFVLELDGVGDLMLHRLSCLLCLDNRLIMSIDCLTQSHEFLTALEALAELEKLDSHVIVDIKSPCVVSQGVQDDLADVSVEGESREDLVLLVNEVHLAVSQNVEFFGSGIVLLNHADFGSLLLFVVKVSDDRFQHFCGLLGLKHF